MGLLGQLSAIRALGHHDVSEKKIDGVTQHKTRWPGYYYRADHPKLNDANWHCFTLSRYDRHSKTWKMEKAPVYHIVD